MRSLNGRKTKIKTPYLSPRKASRTPNPREERECVYPVLRRLGVIRGSTPRFLAEINRQMADGPSSAEAIERLASREIHLSKKKMQNTLRDFASIALWQREAAIRGLAKAKPPEEGRLQGKRIVLGLDGGRIRIRTNRMQDDQTTSKTYTTDKCEPKLFAIYCIDRKGDKERGENIIYDGTIQSADHLFQLLQLRLNQLCVHQAQLLVIIGDGAPWIWNGIKNLRRSLRLGKLRIIEIVDWAHAVGKLSEVAKAGIRAHAQQQLWFRRARRMLKKGELDELKKAFSELDCTQDKENCVARTKDYIETHRSRMQYPKFRKEGLPIGSSVIESGIRRIVNLRLNGASIFWLPEVAEQILCLRCQIKSGQWNSFVKSTLLHDREVIAYNAEFDKRMIEQTCRKNGLATIDRVNWHCLMEKYACFLGRRRRDGTYIPQTLKSACEQQGLSFRETHEAVKDCLATLQLMRAIEAADAQ